MGELLCLFAFYFLKWRAKSKGQTVPASKPFNPLLFLLPALMDLSGTSIGYLGLALTATSVYQLLRGFTVFCTAMLSVIFLKRKLKSYNWIGVALVVGGTTIVGLNLVVCNSSGHGGSGSNPLLGDILIIISNALAAVQMITEEKLISGHNVPALQVVGLEGLFGLSSISILLVVFYFIPAPAFVCTPGTGNNCARFEDTIDAFVMMGNNPKIILFTLGNVISIAFFNFFGVSVTKYLNASTRMILDSLRTVVIWSVSLAVSWESFCYINIIGFVVLLSGTIIYNAVVKLPCLDYEDTVTAVKEEKAGLLADYERDPERGANYEIAPSPVIGVSSDSLYTPSLSKARALKAGR